MRHSNLKHSLLVFTACAIIYTAMASGSVRSLDSEVVYRMAQSLSRNQSVAIESPLFWGGHGTAKGVDGRKYSIFGPAESFFLVPFIAVSDRLEATKWYDRAEWIPLSHNVDRGWRKILSNEASTYRAEHASRFISSLFNILITAATVSVIFLMAYRVAGSLPAAYLTAILLGLGTLMFPYSGTFFSEPLANLFISLSLATLVANDRAFGQSQPSWKRSFWASVFLGIAVTAHISAVLFAPFFMAYASYPFYSRRNIRELGAPVSAFVLGLGILIVLLMYYNYIRFGSALETGRYVSESAAKAFGYGTFTSPFHGMHGLLISSWKGIIWYMPAILIGAIGWRHLHREHRALSIMLISAIAFRFLIIASRTDWHGGHSLGPRYMVMILPLLALPAGLLFRRASNWSVRASASLYFALAICVIQQFYFSLGDIFLYTIKCSASLRRANIMPFENDFIYFNWQLTPLTSLLTYTKGPALLFQSNFSANKAFLVSAGIILSIAILLALLRARVSKH